MTADKFKIMPCLQMAISLLFAITVENAGLAAPGENVDLNRIVTKWRERQSQFLGFTYRCRGKGYIVRGANGTGVDGVTPSPPLDYDFSIEYELSVDVKGSRFRKGVSQRSFYPSDDEFHSEKMITLFDGASYQTYHPLSENSARGDLWPELYLEGPKYLMSFNATDRPITLAHLLFFGKPSSSQRVRDLVYPIVENHYEYVGRLAGHNDSTVVVRTKPTPRGDFWEYWVDLDKECLITHFSRHRLGNSVYLWMEADIEYDKHEQGWLASSWKLQLFEENGELLLMHEMDVVDAQVNPGFSDDTFHVSPSGNIKVMDRATGEEYIPGPPRRDLTELRLQKEQSSRSSTRLILVAVGVFVIIAFTSLLFRRRLASR